MRKCYHGLKYIYGPNKQFSTSKVLLIRVVPISGLTHRLRDRLVIIPSRCGIEHTDQRMSFVTDLCISGVGYKLSHVAVQRDREKYDTYLSKSLVLVSWESGGCWQLHKPPWQTSQSHRLVFYISSYLTYTKINQATPRGNMIPQQEAKLRNLFISFYLFTYFFDHQQSEGGIMFSVVSMCECQQDNSWTNETRMTICGTYIKLMNVQVWSDKQGQRSRAHQAKQINICRTPIAADCGGLTG